MSGLMQRLGRPAIVVVLVALIGGLWIAATPPSAGPDEPSHIVRGAALVRGMLEGEPLDEDTTFYYFELPAETAFPAPNCFAFQPDVPATCATSVDTPTGDAILFTRSSDYPIWGHLLPGVGTLVPGESGNTLARVLDALVPLLLLGGAAVVSARRSALAAGALLLAVTPMAWFTIAVVNPSGYVVAGGVGLWCALLALGDHPPDRSRLVAWLAAASWAAMVLPRRDGLVYAALVLSIVLLARPPDLRRLGVGPLAVVGASTLATLAWATTSDTTSSKALFVAPLAPLAAIGLRRLWQSPALRDRRMRVAAGGGLAVLTLVGMLAVMDRRSGGFDRAALRAAVSRTGTNLRQAIGDLGWLDTPVPDTAVFLWLVALGALVGVAVLEGARRALLASASVVVIGVLTAWTLTMLQNDPTGTYWQGRYYLPLLVGVPLLLGLVRVDRASARRVGLLVGGAGVLVVSVALAQMMRRFSVGTTGSLSPFDWDTYGTALPPVVLLGMHVVASALLLVAVVSLAERSADTRRGINVVGYHHVASGLGEIAREVERSLRAAGVPCTTVDVVATDSPQLRPPRPVDGPLHDTTIAVVTALQLPSAMHDLAEVRASTGHLVGYFFWELDVVPETHRQGIGLVDEVWAPTEFVRGAYAAAADAATPVRLVPTRVDRPSVDEGKVEPFRSEFVGDAGDDTVVFLTSLDLFSVVERKNPAATIEAFRAAFGDADDGPPVRLVVKTINGDQRPDDLAALVAAAADDPRITVVDRYVDAPELHAMVAAADCFVSLHRSEGLGLHLADAMWLGTAVVATRWSGNLDLMDDDCAVLVDAELVPVRDGRGAYPDDARWADPDPVQAADALRRIARDGAGRRRLAAAAIERMSSQPSRAAVGQAMAAALGLADRTVDEPIEAAEVVMADTGIDEPTGSPAGPVR